MRRSSVSKGYSGGDGGGGGSGGNGIQDTVGEARIFSSLLRVFEAAEWDKVFVKMARVVVNYFTDMAFKVLFGSTGSRQSSREHSGPGLPERYRLQVQFKRGQNVHVTEGPPKQRSSP